MFIYPHFISKIENNTSVEQTEGGGKDNAIDESDMAKFIRSQNQMNSLFMKFMEKYVEEEEPPAKKKRTVDDDE